MADERVRRWRGRVALAAAFAALAALWGSAVPAFSADQGSVDAQVTVATPCITVGPGQVVDFGALPFSGPNGESTGVGTPDPSVMSCASTSQQIFAHGTDATGTNAQWNLVTARPQCQPGQGLDAYRLSLLNTATNQFDLYLSTGDTALDPLGAGASRSHPAQIGMPCSGSSGTGETMTMQIVFTATF